MPLAFRTAPVTVLAPATSANLGPGFDCLGLALSLHDQVTARVTDGGVRVTVSGEGAAGLPRDERHLVARTMLTVFDRLGGRPAGIELRCANEIPQARGLGSSSAAIVAGVLLARQLAADGPRRLGQAAIIALAAQLEGHPDNVAACVLGGVSLAWTAGAGMAGLRTASTAAATPGAAQASARAVRLDDAQGVAPVVFVPAEFGYTAAARAALPASVPLADAAFNAARCALLVRALTGSPGLLLTATEDRLHQGYRAAAMPPTAALVAALRADGIAAVLSGSGPSVLALVPDDPQQVARALRHCPDGWWARPVPVAAEGARVTP
jgi:homoserine kinase